MGEDEGCWNGRDTIAQCAEGGDSEELPDDEDMEELLRKLEAAELDIEEEVES